MRQLLTVISLTLLLVIIGCDSSKIPKSEIAQDTTSSIPEPTLMYGVVIDSLDVIEDVVKKNEPLSTILDKYHVDYPTIYELANKSKDVFDVRKIQAGKKYTVMCKKDSTHEIKCFVYQQNPVDYVVFNFEDTLSVYEGQKPVITQEVATGGEITSSLYESIVSNDGSPALVAELSELFAWSIDFFAIQKGDQFKVIYDKKYVEGEEVGMGKIKAASFVHAGETFNAIWFKNDSVSGFYNEKGESNRKQFLKAPLKFSRISSRFNLKRFHPVLKRIKPHLGTDYAAPTGTPIYSVGDGVITRSGYTNGNGRFVKVKHNSIYATQYLHMSKIASGMKKGVRVKQGQVIGYVGQSGLATGPHLCFRFWKNGKQVDALRVKLPPSDPLNEEHMKAFNPIKTQMLSKLDKIEISPKDNKEGPKPVASIIE